MINWLTEIIYIKNINTGDTIKTNRKNAAATIADANKYHNSWLPVTRLESFFS